MDDLKVKNSYEVYADADRSEMLQFIPISAKTVLDVGCSVGNFGKLIKERQSAEVWGIEIDKDAANIASQNLDNVICSAFDGSTELGGKKFDCVVFNDVLEHMIDPYSALGFARSILGPNGVVVASIPNVRYFGNIWLLLIHRSWEYIESGILDRTHLRFFTEKSIKTCLSTQALR